MATSASKNVYVDFSQEMPMQLHNTATGITALAATTTVNAFKTRAGHYFEMYNDGQNDQLVLTGGAIGSTGWVPPLDNAADGLEITRGINTYNALSTFTTGTDPAFFIRVGGKVGTIARTTVLTVGFRVQEAYVAIKGADATAALTAHPEKAMVGTVAVAGTMATQTSKANSDTQTSLAHAAIADSTWFSYEVNVSSAGAVTYRIGTSLTSLAAAEAALAADANAVAFTFTAGTIVGPSIMMVGTAATGINDTGILKFECGYQV
jgi:hypothetical protein